MGAMRGHGTGRWTAIVAAMAAMLLCAGGRCHAQAMTDDQIMRFVRQEQEKGATQQDIIERLVQRGVTVEQIRRVRRSYEAQQKNMGAVDLTGEGTDKTTNRLRTNKEKAEDEYRQKNNFLVKSKRQTEEERYKTRQDVMDEIGDEIGFLDIDSLIYYQNYFAELQDTRNKVFGRDIFNNELLTFEPSQNLATPPNYRLGPGDKVYIDVWGAAQESFEETVSPDGYVVVDGVGPLRLSGLTVAQARERVRDVLGKYYEDCDFNLSLGENRSIVVQVLGEVRMPGTYTISSLSTPLNALYSAGGIGDIGTLRSIKIYRSGREAGELDVYDYLLNGAAAAGEMRLQDNDVIVVGPYECLVQMTGKVKRPMFYEMRNGETLAQALRYSGGFAGDAYTGSVRLSRKSGREYSLHTVDEFHIGDFNVEDGDSVFVDSVVARYSNCVEIRGAVMHEGQFQLGGDVQTVRGLLAAAQGVREDAFLSRGVMHRLQDDLTLGAMGVDVEAILSGDAPDIPLRNGDVLYIPSVVDMKAERTLTISGEVMYPGTYQYADSTCVEDLILMAGGLTEGASMAKIDVFRRIADPGATENTGDIVETYTVSLADGLRHRDGDMTLRPYDEVVVRKSPLYSEQQNVSVYGCVNFEGEYSMASRDYRLSDLVSAAGGLTSFAYADGARLVRKLTEGEKLMKESSIRSAQIQIYEDAMQSETPFDMAQADSLMALKLDLGDYYPVAINLSRAIQRPGGKDDIALQEGDILSVPQFSNTVKVSGEVIYTMSMGYESGKGKGYYIQRAGGYGNKAKRKGTYAIYINGSAKKLGRRSSGDIKPGCEIVVPTKPAGGSKITVTEVVAITSGIASLSAVIVALTNLVQ